MSKDLQLAVCEQNSAPFVNAADDSICGVALSTLTLRPLNGLRHPPAGNSNGWYVWGGDYSDKADFFQPIHARHLGEYCAEIEKFLGLPPGYRWLSGEGNEDVWFDDALLKID